MLALCFTAVMTSGCGCGESVWGFFVGLQTLNPKPCLFHQHLYQRIADSPVLASAQQLLEKSGLKA